MDGHCVGSEGGGSNASTGVKSKYFVVVSPPRRVKPVPRTSLVPPPRRRQRDTTNLRRQAIQACAWRQKLASDVPLARYLLAYRGTPYEARAVHYVLVKEMAEFARKSGKEQSAEKEEDGAKERHRRVNMDVDAC